MPIREITSVLGEGLVRTHSEVEITQWHVCEPGRRQSSPGWLSAGYYLELDQLADDDPQIVSRLPVKLLDSRAKACGVDGKRALRELVAYLSRR